MTDDITTAISSRTGNTQQIADAVCALLSSCGSSRRLRAYER